LSWRDGRSRENPVHRLLSAVSIVVNIVANFVLIPYMGISGAALASSISYSLVSVVVLWYYLRETRLPWSVLVPRWSDLFAYAALSRKLGGYSPLRAGMPEVASTVSDLGGRAPPELPDAGLARRETL